MQWLQDLGQISEDNMKNLGHHVIGKFRNEWRKCPKDKFNELATDSKNKSSRDLYKGKNDHRLKEAYDSIRRKLLYSILTEIDIPMKVVRLIKMFRMYMLPS